MSAMASQITSVSIICSTVCSGAGQRKQQSSASLACVREIQRWPVDSHHKGPVTRKIFLFDDGHHASKLRRFLGDLGQSRTESRFAPSQWETSLQSNAVPHWLDANQESALQSYEQPWRLWANTPCKCTRTGDMIIPNTDPNKTIPKCVCTRTNLCDEYRLSWPVYHGQKNRFLVTKQFTVFQLQVAILGKNISFTGLLCLNLSCW